MDRPRTIASAGVERTLGIGDGEHGPPGVLARGTVVGRYIVLGELGAGGMGVVFAAYDPELDRKVALKLLHPFGTGDRSESHGRALREAQALAKLAHPSIVAIHDVGMFHDRVWLAMEFVAGTTLRGWSSARTRTWQEVLEVMIASGRGLVAAHAAGLVHRDFKPDNVMIGDDGRARVMDFGLARHSADSEYAPPASGLEDTRARPRLQALQEAMTRAGAFSGTPAYMAAEQIIGATIDARTDQFAWCVTAWEALHGERPFTGDTLLALSAEVLAGKPRAAPRSSRTPRWVRRIVVRGLSPDPAKRWPSMTGLIAALERGRARARWRRSGTIAAVLGVAGLGAVLAGAIDERRRVAACERDGAEIETIWNDGARAGLRDAVIGTGVAYAATTADRVVPWIDAQASAWRGARIEACLDADVRSRWSADTLDRALWCLEERRDELASIVLTLTNADAQVVLSATRAVANLMPIDACRDEEMLARSPAPSVDSREEARAIREELARGRARAGAGKASQSLAPVRAAAERARALGWPPLVAAAAIAEADLLMKSGALEEAARVGADAYFDAAREGLWSAAADAALGQLALHGNSSDGLGDSDEALRWDRHVELALAHAGDGYGLREANRLFALANARRAAGQIDAAAAMSERALLLRSQLLGTAHPDLARDYGNLAVMHVDVGDYTQARRLCELAIETTIAALGPDHPDVAIALGNLGSVDLYVGEYGRAKATLERAIAISEAAWGVDHATVAAQRLNLASVQLASGDHARARESYERALASFERALPPEHPAVAIALTNLGLAHAAAGDYARASSLHERALAIAEPAIGNDHPDVAIIVEGLAESTRGLGDLVHARSLHERALAIREKAFGPTHPEVAAILVGLAETLLAAEHPDLARPIAERALAIYDAREGIQEHELKGRFVLARALVATHGDRSRARALAQEARDGWRDRRPVEDRDLAAVKAWLAALP